MSLESHVRYLESKGYTCHLFSFQILFENPVPFRGLAEKNDCFDGVEHIVVRGPGRKQVFSSMSYTKAEEELAVFVKQLLKKELEKILPQGNPQSRPRF